MVAVSAPLKGADLVVEALYEAQRDLVLLVAIRLDTVPGLLPQARLACYPIDIPPGTSPWEAQTAGRACRRSGRPGRLFQKGPRFGRGHPLQGGGEPRALIHHAGSAAPWGTRSRGFPRVATGHITPPGRRSGD
jgi:hypothetical protein